MITAVRRIALLLALGALACRGKVRESDDGPSASPAPEAEAAGAPEPEAPAVPIGAGEARHGFVEATIAGRSRRFETLPPDRNQVFERPRASRVRITALPEQGATEALLVQLDNYELDQMVGRPLMLLRAGTGGRGTRAALVTYTAPDGEVYYARSMPGTSFEVTLEQWSRASQLATGTFAGELRQRGGPGTIEIAGGRFSTELDRDEDGGGEAPAGR